MSNPQPTKSVVYKVVAGLDISLDIYLPENTKHSPVLLWFHGGGLLQGHRRQLAQHMRDGVRKYGFTCISADYRLAPQVGVKEILEDVKDSIGFIRTKLREHVPPNAVDVSRLAVSGSSAGGYLALLAGLYVEPKPHAIVPIYPITDPLGSFFTTSQPAPLGRHVASEEEMEPYLDPTAKPVANCGPLPDDARMHMYVRMMASANLANLLGMADVETASPFRIARNVYEHKLPPAYFLHGDADEAVGVEQSDEVVGAMLGCGIEVVYERPHGKNHFLDSESNYSNAAMYAFVLKHL